MRIDKKIKLIQILPLIAFIIGIVGIMYLIFIYLFSYSQLEFLDKSTNYILYNSLLGIIIIGCLILLFWFYNKEKRIKNQNSEFINNMTHELKTPISSIALIIENLRERNDKEFDKYYNIIDQENKRTRNIIERILEFGRLEKTNLRCEEFDIHDLLKDISNTYISTYNALDIRLSLLASNSNLFLDKLHINNAINTLIDNSIKYNSNPPIIEISTNDINNSLEISIKDNGIGIPIKERKKVFKAYYRLNNTLNKKGFGLGLPYVKYIIEKHGGRVFIDNNIIEGTCIKIHIPNNRIIRKIIN